MLPLVPSADDVLVMVAAGRASTPRWCPTAPSAARCRGSWIARPRAGGSGRALRETHPLLVADRAGARRQRGGDAATRGAGGPDLSRLRRHGAALVAPGGVDQGRAGAVRPRPRRQRAARPLRPRAPGRGPPPSAGHAASTISSAAADSCSRRTSPAAPSPSGTSSATCLDGLLPSLLYLTLAAVVLALRPGARETRVFLFFCLTWFCTAGALRRLVDDVSLQRAVPHRVGLRPRRLSPHRAALPADAAHRAALALADRGSFYVLSGFFALGIQLPFTRVSALIPAVAGAYWASGPRAPHRRASSTPR